MEKKALRVTQIIWVTFISTNLIYLALLKSGTVLQGSPQPLPPISKWVILGLGFFQIALGYLVPPIILRFAKNPFPAFIARMALYESGVLLGFVFAVMTKDIRNFYPLFAAGFVSMALAFPRADKL